MAIDQSDLNIDRYAKEIFEHRDKTGDGIYTSKKHFQKKMLLEAIQKSDSIEDLKLILTEIIEHL